MTYIPPTANPSAPSGALPNAPTTGGALYSLVFDTTGVQYKAVYLAGTTASTTATTPVPVPSSATVGTPITGITTTISPSGATAYAVLFDGTSDVGGRVGFTGSALPALTPQSINATHSIRLYPSLTGGIAIAVGATFSVVAAVVASPAIAIGNVTGRVQASQSQVTGSFANGAPTGLTATSDGAALTLTGVQITTASGTGNTASGTMSALFTTPVAGTHALIVAGTGTYAATSGAYSYAATAPSTGTVGLVSPAFFVSPTGIDTAAGTAAAPFKTFAKAQSAMQAGTTKTVYIRGGIHNTNPQLLLTETDNNTSWLGYPGEVPIIDGNATLASPFVLQYYTQNVTIDHLTIRNCVLAAIELHGGGGAPGCAFNKITNNEIYNVTATITPGNAGASAAIRCSFNAINNTIKNNYIHDVDCVGILFVAGTTSESIAGNEISYNKVMRTNRTGQNDTGGIYLLDRGHGKSNVVINYNYVEDTSSKPFGGGAGASNDNTRGIYLDDMSSWVTVSNNIICGKQANAIQYHGGDNNNFSNNILDLSSTLLMALYQDDTQFGGIAMPANSFRKNIVYSSVAYTGNAGQVGQPGLWTVGFVAGMTKPDSSGNLYWNTSNTTAPFPLAGSIDVVDPTGKIVNPNFTNAATRDYSFTDAGAAAAAAIGFTPIDMSLIGPRVVSIGTAAATLSGVTTLSTVGGSVTGSVTLANIVTAYAVLYYAGADEGTRTAFTGSLLPTLRPAVQGAHTLRVYDAATGGTLLAESGTISVGAAVPAATLSAVTTSLSLGGAISGNVSLYAINTVYVGLYVGGVAEGVRVSTGGPNLPGLAPQTVASTYTVRVYTLASGGTLLAESGAIAVRASGALISPAFFVSTAGNDANAGTAAAPFATLEAARTAMRATTTTKTTYIRGGTYARTAQFTLAGSPGMDAGTSWLGYPGEVPIIDGGGTIVALIQLNYWATNITIDHLTVQNCAGSGIYLSGYQTPGDDGTITGCMISNNTIKNVGTINQYGAGNCCGVRATFATRNNTIRNNLIMDTYGPSIALVAGGANEWSIGNKVLRNRCLRSNNTNQSDTGTLYFLDRGHNGDPTNPTVVDGNYVEDVGAGLGTKHIYLDDNSSCFTITNNIFAGIALFGLQLHGSDHVSITNNIWDLSQTPNVTDHFLTLYQDVTGVNFTNYGMTLNTFTKNIIYTSGSYTQTQMWQVVDGSGGKISNPSVNNNLYFSTVGTLPATAGSVPDSAPQVGNPLFANAALRDYSFTGTTGTSKIGFVPINQALIGPQ